MCGFRNFELLARRHRRSHTHLTLPSHHSSYWGGRTAHFRVPQKSAKRFKENAPQWKLDQPTMQFNVDVWAGQQSLRRKWKGREWRVVELPFERAPAVLQRVIPELHSELPVMADPKTGDYTNIRAKTFAVEDPALQETVYGSQQLPLPVKRSPRGSTGGVTLDSFFSTAAEVGTPR